MIAKSDLIILLVSASALGAGVARWQMNIAPEAPVRTVAPAAPVAPATSPAPAVAPAAEPAVIASTPRPRAETGVEARTAALPENRADASRDTDTLPDAAPAPELRDPADNPVAPISGEPLYGEYEVVSGDNLSAIALRFGTSVANLRRINALEGTTILVGQRLRYPQAAN